MDKVITEIHKFSETKEDLEKIAKKNEWIKTFKKSSPAQIDTGLGMCELPRHTYGYLQILHYKSTTEIKDHKEFIDQVIPLCQNGDRPQLDLDQKKFAEVCRKMTDSLLIVENYIKGVQPLRAAISKLQGQNGHLLTPVHADFALVCLKSQHYEVAAETFSTALFEVDKNNGLTPEDYLRAHYYAGMIFIGMKEYDKALEAFQMALILESHVLSAIQIAVYKKFVLVSLLVHGEVVEIPDRLSGSLNFVLKQCKKNAHAYTELAKAFKKGAEYVAKVIEDFIEDITKDSNLGLAKQVQKAVLRRNIGKLTSTYITLSFEDIAKRTKLKSAAEAEQHVLRMIDDGDITAKINQQGGRISFLEQLELYDDAEMSSKLDGKVKEIILLTKEVKKKDVETSLDINYLSMTMPGGDDEEGLAMGLHPGLRGESSQDRILAQVLAHSLETR